MGLKVWLPLNEDLHNQGCSNIVATNINATIDDNGKIGKCYNFAGSGQRIKFANPITNGINSFSICTWFYITAVNGGLFGARTSGSGKGLLGFLYADRILFDDGARFICNYNINNLLNSWHHITFVKTPTQKIIYIDGVLAGSQNTTAVTATIKNEITIGNDTYETYTGNDLIGKLNDFRIYDHCLSAAEVKEISQGLVLHYKLDTLDIQSGTNLVTGVTAGGRTTVLTDGRIGVQTIGVNQDTYFTINLSENIVAGTSYVFTCDASGISDEQYWGFPLGAQANSGVLPFKIYNGHNVYPFTANSTKSDGTTMDWGTKRLFMDDNYRGDWANQACFYNFQLVKIGASDTVIKTEDSSGYNHNGVIIGTTTLVSSPRYSFGTAMNNTSTANRIDATSLPTEVQTISLWVKGNKSTYQVYFADKNSTLEFGTYNSLGATNLSSKPLYKLDNFITNEWNHIVVIKNSTNNKLYVNGVEAVTGSSSNCYTHNDKLYLFNRNYNNNYACNGAISDFRAYVTALDIDAIRQLYEVGAKVDNKQNIHTFELAETTKNQITKMGQLKGNLMSEFGNMSYLKYDHNLYIEPDGSCWVRVFHHNNPGAGSFASSNDFAHSVYIDENRWFNVELANYLDKWEIMIKGKFTSTSDEWKLRWIQQYNPMTATFANVAVANITKITTDGYSASPSAWGGLYFKNGSTYLCANNGTNGNWWGAVGSYSVYQSGIPGWGPSATVTTTGFNDMYLRIDNVTFTSPSAKTTKNNVWTAAEFVEM